MREEEGTHTHGKTRQTNRYANTGMREGCRACADIRQTYDVHVDAEIETEGGEGSL